MTFGQIYGALKKGRWFGQESTPNIRVCIVGGKYLVHDSAIDSNEVTTLQYYSISPDMLLAEDWVVYN
jgi:hypothetical protein